MTSRRPRIAPSAATGSPSLRVGVDARVGSERGTGVATYAATLIDTLRQAGVEVERVVDALPGPGRGGRLVRWRNAAAPGPRRLVADDDGAGRIWRRGDLFREAQVHFNLYGRMLELTSAAPPDIMHWTYPLPLYLRGARNLYTVHDLIPLDHPDLTGIDAGRHRRLLAAICARADALVTVSAHSRARIIHHLPDFRRPIFNTCQAVAPLPAPAPLPAGLTPGGYLLICGTVEPRKNLPRVIAAYQESGVALPLVVVGPDGWRAANELPVQATPSIVRLPWVERPTLGALLRHARALLFVSLAEGFGLPLVEAMALGVPAVAAAGGAAAEIAGGAALMVDAYDVCAIARAIRRVTTDELLRMRLQAAGPVRAAEFGQADYARRLLDAYGERK